jgi:DNA polymerase III subunit epsilon
VSLLAASLRTSEFLAVDTETNGRAGESCELTEIGAVLVGGGELHDRWSSLVRPVAPLGRSIQRFTGISQRMVDDAPRPEAALPNLDALLQGRVLVAHSAAFDTRVLRQAYERAGLEWPDPPVLCTVALALRLLPLQPRRGLASVADALGIEVEVAHRALPDAETCARVFCALFQRLCAHAGTVEEARALLRSRREPRVRAPRRGRPPGARRAVPALDFGDLPADPGVYLFRDGAGRILYVGKSVCVRSRARAHFAPTTGGGAWTAQAVGVDYRATASELGALVLEARLVKELRPPGNVRLRPDDRLVYITCRLDAPFPVLEVAERPAPGRAVNVGPMRGRSAAGELVEQLDSLFGLRHCGRALPRREHPSAYGQMGRCLSPCLGDLDPNLYRRRLDAALAVFTAADPGRERLLAHVEGLMRGAAAEQAFERAASLRRRLGRLRTLLGRLDGPLRAAHAQPRLVLAAHPARPAWDAFWLGDGRVLDAGPAHDLDELVARPARTAARAAAAGVPSVPAAEVDALRVVETWLASHPDTPVLGLRPAPSPERVRAFAAGLGVGEGEPDELARDAVLAHRHGGAGLGLAPDQGQADRPSRGRHHARAQPADDAVAQLELGARLG